MSPAERRRAAAGRAVACPPRRRGAVRVLVVVAALGFAGCGAAERNQRGTTASASDRVVVEVRAEGEAGPAETRTVSCTSLTPQCRRLRDADFDPPSVGACTQVYGGPAVATVSGKAGGRAVDAEFSLANGCEIDRWREFSWLLGEPPGQ